MMKGSNGLHEITNGKKSGTARKGRNFGNQTVHILQKLQKKQENKKYLLDEHILFKEEEEYTIVFVFTDKWI